MKIIVESKREVDLDEILEDYIIDIRLSLEDNIEDFVDYANANYEVPKENLAPILPKLEERYNKERKKSLDYELENLKDRESISDWLEDIIDYPYEGDVGYILSIDEIIDLIIKNGNK